MNLPTVWQPAAKSADFSTLSDRDTYRPRPPEQATTGPCQTCRFRLGDYCAEDGLKLAPGSCPHYERTPPILSDSQRKRLHDRWRSLLSRLTQIPTAPPIGRSLARRLGRGRRW